MKMYLEKHLSVFPKEMFFNSSKIKKDICAAFFLIFGIFLFISLVKSNFYFLPINYFKQGVTEIVGVHAWNIIGALGLMFTGIFFIYPKNNFPSKIGQFLLLVAYSTGLWSFGVILSEIIYSIPELFTKMEFWKAILAILLIFILLLLIFLINYTMLFASQILEKVEKNKIFYGLIENLHFPIRLSIFFVLTIFPLIFLLFEK
ncbi:hypothetical protein [Acinetobacter baumannii]|uniref:hypothetical protein n=1 Tax=Acinetobacter baumannii TaxID=470 RepID=UPI002447C29D|nr:hypothetical protein [Acinetobacter baumannii]MDH2595950.1 hypothetical protein [Acinetobacter baumannii]